MRKTILTIFTIFLIATSGLGFVSAENITETEVESESEEKSNKKEINPYENNRTGEKVEAKESGNYNITFNDGYSGYCINYGDHAADRGDDFIVKNTSNAINHNSGESIGNYLKVLFVDYHDIAVKDKTKTQYLIWAFSDDYNYRKDLVNEIKQVAVDRIIPDQGAVKKINNTTEATFYFEVLDSIESWTQNFFAYKIEYRTITPETVNNTTDRPNNNLGSSEQNNTTNNDTNLQPPIQNNTTNIPNNSLGSQTPSNEENNTTEEPPIENTTIPENNSGSEEPPIVENTTENEEINENIEIEDNSKEEQKVIEKTPKKENGSKGAIIDNEEKNILLSKHVTGNSWIPILIIIAIFSVVLVIKYKRD